MSPKRRLALQAVLYELFAIVLVGPVLSVLFGQSIGSSLSLAAVLSTIALLWNYVFNMIFELWESRQESKDRTLGRRLLHGIGFEGGLVVLLVPVMAWWLETTLLTAFATNLGLLAFFFFYAILFTWAFDRIFGLPASAAPLSRSDAQ
jgi:uncharacterized membrane protein